jgi:7-carboxy-7-deazaguanine synthase
MDNTSAGRILPLKLMQNKEKILVHEIYASIQGESTFSGEICTFVRTTACHLRCSYCDTKHAFYRGSEKSISEIKKQIDDIGIKLVEITGGEPLLQKPVTELMRQLCEDEYQVLLETSGAVSIGSVDKRVHIIVDIKMPGSGEVERNVWANLELLSPICEVKFVISHEEDYRFAKKIIENYRLSDKCKILMSPETQKMSGKILAEWMIRDKLAARFQTQLHKILWGNQAGV